MKNGRRWTGERTEERMGERVNGGGGLAKGWWQPLHPGPSKNGGKPSDLDGPQAAERPLRHHPHPGHSKNGGKSSDLDGRK